MAGEPDHDRCAELFHQALQLPTVQREAFVHAQCPADAAMAAEVCSLLRADQPATQAGLRSPLRGLVAQGTPPSIGPYAVIRELGEGGMGRVYAAVQHAPMRRVVAIKVMRQMADMGQAKLYADIFGRRTCVDKH